MKLEVKVPILSLKDADGGKARKKKDYEGPPPVVGKGGVPSKRKGFDEVKKGDVPMTVASFPSYKPPSRKDMMKDTVHSALRESTRKWVLGEIPTSKHKENVRRASNALSGMPKTREGKIY